MRESKKKNRKKPSSKPSGTKHLRKAQKFSIESPEVTCNKVEIKLVDEKSHYVFECGLDLNLAIVTGANDLILQMAREAHALHHVMRHTAEGEKWSLTMGIPTVNGKPLVGARIVQCQPGCKSLLASPGEISKVLRG